MARRKRRQRRLHHEPIIRQVAAILDLGRPTRFAHEGACRHGLRVRMIQSGKSWREADDFAALVIKLALHRLGVTRPTWLEAQPDYAAEFFMTWSRCAACGDPLDDADHGRKYCTPECAKYALNARYYRRSAADIEIMHAAYEAGNGKAPTRVCRQCGKSFELDRYNGAQMYCGTECSNAVQAAQAKNRKRRTCPTCGTEFTALHWHNEFCSYRCSGAARRTLSERECPHCRKVFRPRNRNIRFCSPACGNAARRERTLRCEEAA
ncbi:MAG: hypothetical protein K2Y27_00895 [Xanthobacteraceae bacterium]|nr:hypothetical protein [Xanthobacteraceae bacterium]